MSNVGNEGTGRSGVQAALAAAKSRIDGTQPGTTDDLLLRLAQRFEAVHHDDAESSAPSAATATWQAYQPPDDKSAMAAADTGQPVTMAIPSDSLFSQQWHLRNTQFAGIDLNVTKVWDDYTGVGVTVGVVDDGVDYNHGDISPNYRFDLDFDARNNDFDSFATASDDRHGTATLGMISGAANGSGIVGVAPDADATMYRMGFGAAGSAGQITTQMQNMKNVDVANNSWGFDGFFGDLSGASQAAGQAVTDAAQLGRDGLGTVVIFSAGNARADGQDVNYHSFQNSPYVISVGAINQNGSIASFSTPGAAVLVSAPGVGIVTTDRVGAAGYVAGDFVSISGTSFSAPAVAGVTALMLEANPGLGFRDVQEILALTATQPVASDAGWQTNGATNWNGGGMFVSHDYGYGLVDALAAVRLAETWMLGGQGPATVNHVSALGIATPNATISDFGTVTSSITITEGVEIDRVLVQLNVTHTWIGDLTVTLTSPDGTVSRLVNRPGVTASNPDGASQDNIEFQLSSVQFWGENGVGTWTLAVTDSGSGDTGRLNSWVLSPRGDPISQNDVYFYTDDWARHGDEAERQMLTDTGGTDAINMAAVTANVTLDLNAGGGAAFFGHSFDIAAGTVIENAYMGDGADTVIGNAADNFLWGGRGNDTLIGGAGDDLLALGAGFDTVVFATGDGFDILEDFDAGLGLIDLIDLTGLSGIYDFLDIQAAAVLDGFDTVLSFFGGDGLRLLDVLPSDLASDDFLFGTAPPTNAPPVAGDDGTPLPIAGSEDGTLTILAANLLANDSDADHDALSLVAVGSGVGGTVVLNAQGNVEFTPTANYSGPASFTYTVADGQGGFDTGAVNLSFAPVADAPHLTVADAVIAVDAVDQTIVGTSAANTLTGGKGDDTISGLGGNDTLYGDPQTASFGAQTVGLDIAASLGDLDGSETLHLTVSGVPAGAVLSAGTDSGGGSWVLGAGNLAGLTLTTPAGFSQAFTLTVTAVATDTGPGGPVASAPVSGTIHVTYSLPAGGDDVLIGGTGNDILYGGVGNDTFTVTGTGEGDDTFFGGDGIDRILGGAGNDTIGIKGPFNAASSIESIDGGGGVNIVRGTTGNDTLDFSATALINIARIDGGGGADTITGTALADVIAGGSGDDNLSGGAGDDTFTVAGSGDGYDSVNGGIGFDRILGGAGSDAIGLRGTFNAANGIELIDGGGGVNVVRGGGGNDVLDFSAITLLNIASLQGGGGNDTVTGTGTADLIIGGSGDDNLFGGAGDDTFTVAGSGDGYDSFNGGTGFDRILGGSGDDAIGLRGTFNAASSIELIDGGAGVNVLRGGGGNDVLDFSATTLVGIASLQGGGGNDTITGTEGADTIAGGSGDDTLRGGNGDDTFTVAGSGDGFDSFNGGAGFDRILGSAADDTIGLKGTLNAASGIELIDGGTGLNILRGSSSGDVLDFSAITLLNIAEIRGGGGDDVLTGTAGDDTFTVAGTGDGYDTFNGGGGFDRILGSAADDAIGLKGGFSAARSIEAIDGGAGLNILRGTTGNDSLDFSATTLTNIARIEGGGGGDTIIGTGAADTIAGGSGDDVLRGGGGDDTFTVAGSGEGYDSYNGGTGFDRILGGSGDDAIGLKGPFNAASSIEAIDGGAGLNILRGTTGNDSLDFSATALTNIARIEGGSGNDTLIGSAGADTLVGGANNDLLTGGAGDDTFLFATGSGSDTVTDFGVGDRLVFEAFAVGGLIIQQQGANVLLQFSGNTLGVTLHNTAAADLGYSMGSGSEANSVVVRLDDSLV